jgi:hypothetical protein
MSETAGGDVSLPAVIMTGPQARETDDTLSTWLDGSSFHRSAFSGSLRCLVVRPKSQALRIRITSG